MNALGFGVMALAFALALALVPLLRPLAHRLPSGVKQHRQPTAIAGGVAMFIAFVATTPWLSATAAPVSVLMLCALLVVAVGVIDDRLELPTRVRFAAQILAGVLMCTQADVLLTDMGWLQFDGGQPVQTIKHIDGVDYIDNTEHRDRHRQKTKLGEAAVKL